MQDDEVPHALTHDAPSEMTAAQFEQLVAAMFEQTRPLVERLTVTPHERVEGVDGTYDFDATVRYRLGGMDFLVVVEAKRHKNPVKRDVVQTLHSKVTSVGAHKGVIVSTAGCQRGALKYASTHGIALVRVTGGAFRYEMRMMVDLRGAADIGVTDPKATCWVRTDTALQSTVVSDEPDYALQLLLL